MKLGEKEGFAMKAISSSIIVLSGAIMISTSMSGVSDLHRFLFFMGSGVVIIGVIGWLFQVVAKG
jgi:hypothetical protein